MAATWRLYDGTKPGIGRRTTAEAAASNDACTPSDSAPTAKTAFHGIIASHGGQGLALDVLGDDQRPSGCEDCFNRHLAVGLHQGHEPRGPHAGVCDVLEPRCCWRVVAEEQDPGGTCDFCCPYHESDVCCIPHAVQQDNRARLRQQVLDVLDLWTSSHKRERQRRFEPRRGHPPQVPLRPLVHRHAQFRSKATHGHHVLVVAILLNKHGGRLAGAKRSDGGLNPALLHVAWTCTACIILPSAP